ncbi:MAG: hypothetical protein J0L93_08825 [Deltaproteobacteria bacterium]|nr:hypothetical protein [Deltaproteobacteria bacterium]
MILGIRIFILSSLVSSAFPMAHAQETMTSSNPTDDDQTRFDQLVEPTDDTMPSDTPQDLPPSDEISQD